jgi:L-rhamnonate dehydratase
MTFVEIVTDGGLVGTAGPIMLGGPTRKRVPAYVSTLGTSLEPERASATAARFAKLGFGAMKWFPRFGPADGVEGLRRNVELVRVLREAIGGDVRLMIDAWMSWDVPYTLEFAELTADHDLYWIEDPVMPERLDGLAELSRERGNRPRLASGERAYTRVKSGFERRAHGSEADRAR